MCSLSLCLIRTLNALVTATYLRDQNRQSIEYKFLSLMSRDWMERPSAQNGPEISLKMMYIVVDQL
jgi:hypothetical protein